MSVEIPRRAFLKAVKDGRVGDVISAALRKAGVKECPGCLKRKEAMNDLGQAVANALRSRKR